MNPPKKGGRGQEKERRKKSSSAQPRSRNHDPGQIKTRANGFTIPKHRKGLLPTKDAREGAGDLHRHLGKPAPTRGTKRRLNNQNRERRKNHLVKSPHKLSITEEAARKLGAGRNPRRSTPEGAKKGKKGTNRDPGRSQEKDGVLDQEQFDHRKRKMN